MQPPSAAPPWAPQMLCSLARGDHEAFQKGHEARQDVDSCRGKTDNSSSKTTPRTTAQPPSAAPPWASKMRCWLAFGDHEAFKKDMNRGMSFLPADRSGVNGGQPGVCSHAENSNPALGVPNKHARPKVQHVYRCMAVFYHAWHASTACMFMHGCIFIL